MTRVARAAAGCTYTRIYHTCVSIRAPTQPESAYSAEFDSRWKYGGQMSMGAGVPQCTRASQPPTVPPFKTIIYLKNARSRHSSAMTRSQTNESELWTRRDATRRDGTNTSVWTGRGARNSLTDKPIDSISKINYPKSTDRKVQLVQLYINGTMRVVP